MRILHFTQSAPGYIPPPEMSIDQVVAGPNVPDHADQGRVRSIHTEPGRIDAVGVLDRLPVDQRPELVVVRTDSSGLCRPWRLDCFDCPVVLVVGDTHHLPGALRGLVAYAQSHPFLFVGLDYTRQHAHFFAEAGVSRVCWLPGFNVLEDWVIGESTFASEPGRITFVGSLNQWHPRRLALIQDLIAQGLPLKVHQAPRRAAAEIHASSQICLNTSLNGDLNLRTLEILASGGLLLTDRLKPEAGLDLLFENDRHLCLYDSIEHCAERISDLLRDPSLCSAIATAGHRRWRSLLHPDLVRSRFFALLEGGSDSDVFNPRHDPRFLLEWDPQRRASLDRRCRTYDAVQHLHTVNEELVVVASPSLDPDTIVDLIDLSQARIIRLESAPDALDSPSTRRFDDLLDRTGLRNRVDRTRLEDIEDIEDIEVLLLSESDLRHDWVQRLLSRKPEVAVVFDSSPATDTIAGAGLEPLDDVPDAWRLKSVASANAPPSPIPVPIEHFFQSIDGWFTFPALYVSLVRLLPEDGRFVEVGSWKGQSLAFFLTEMLNRRRRFEVFAVDTWDGSPEHAGTSEVIHGTLFDEFTRNLRPVESAFTAIRSPSVVAASRFEDESIDAVFIDAGHEYEDVMADLEAWHPKVKRHGYLCGHDYSAAWPGVIRAVNEFFRDRPGELISCGDEYCWVSRKS